MKVHTGAADIEFIVIKWTNCKPHFVMVVYYGQQSQVFRVDTIKLYIIQLLEVVKKQLDLGCHVNVTGDFNLWIGDRVNGNHPNSSVIGGLFLDQVDALGLEILNSRSDIPIMFINKSKESHKKLVLDLVLSNQLDSISEFRTDEGDFLFTPYSVQMRRGKSSYTFADHMSIIYQVCRGWNMELQEDAGEHKL